MFRLRSSQNCRAAFTLMEMMVVVVIIGIMTAMIIPEMKGTFEDALLRSTGRQFIDAISLASSRAISLNQSHRVEFDARTGRLAVESRSRNARDEFTPLKDVAGSENKLDARIAVEIQKMDDLPAENFIKSGAPEKSPENAIVFYPDGTADAARIRLRDRAGFQLVLQLNPVTSRIEVVEPEKE